MVKIRAHKLREDDVRYVRDVGTGGRNLPLIKLVPLKDDAVSPDMGAGIVEQLYGESTHDFRILSKHPYHLFCLEYRLENGRVTIYFGASKKGYKEKAKRQFQAVNPGMYFEETQNTFINLIENDWVACARLRSSRPSMPFEIIESDRNLVPLFSAMNTDDKNLRMIVQILIKPCKKYPFQKTNRETAGFLKKEKVTKYGATPPTERDIKLSEMLAKKASQPHFWVEIRICAVGAGSFDKNKDMEKKREVEGKLMEVIGTFERFNSDCNGNKFITVPMNGGPSRHWLKFLNVMEDRNMSMFINWDKNRNRIYLSRDELGHNFFTFPTQTPVPPNMNIHTARVFPMDKKAKEVMGTSLTTPPTHQGFDITKRVLIPGVNGVKADPVSIKLDFEITPIFKEYLHNKKHNIPVAPEWKQYLELETNNGLVSSDTPFMEKLEIKKSEKWSWGKQEKLLKKFYKEHPEKKFLLEYQPKEWEMMKYLEEEPWYTKIPEYIKRNLLTLGWVVDSEDMQKKMVAMMFNHLKYHMLIDGESGAGKSNFIGYTATQSIGAGHNVVLFDPHGDHQNNTIRFLADEMADHWINLDPADSMPVGMNLLQYSSRKKLLDENKRAEINKIDSTKVNNIIEMFKRIWGMESVGPQAEDVLRTMLKDGIGIEKCTISDIQLVLRDPENYGYRFYTKNMSEDLRIFLQKDVPNYQAYQLTSSINKLKRFSTDDILRHTFCYRDTPVEIDDLIAPSKLIYVNTSIQDIGEEQSRFVGAAVLNIVWTIIISKKKPNNPDEFMTLVFLDEFQNYAPYNFGGVLSSARKYNVGLILVIQYLDQLVGDLQASTKNNVGTTICFKVGTNDAEEMAKWLSCRAVDISERHMYEAVCRIKVEVSPNRIETSDPMTIFTFPPIPFPLGWQERLEKLKKASREKYGRPIKDHEHSMFSGIVQEVYDLLQVLRTLKLQLDRDEFSESELKNKLDNLCLHTVPDDDFVTLLDYAIEGRYIEANDKIFYTKYREKRRKGTYKMLQAGLEHLKIKTGKGPIAGYEVHEWLLSQAQEFFLRKNIKMRVLPQKAGSIAPDAEIMVVPDMSGFTPKEEEEIKNRIDDTWLYKYCNGMAAINVEAVSSTLRKPEKIMADLSKAISAKRLLLWIVENRDNANQLNSLAEKMMTDPTYCVITPDRPYSTKSFVRKPEKSDYKILVFERNPETDEVEALGFMGPNQFRLIKPIDIPSVDESIIGTWKIILPVLEDVLKNSLGDKKHVDIGFSDIFDKCKNMPNFSRENLMHTFEKCKIQPTYTKGDDPMRWTYSITPHTVRVGRGILEEADELQRHEEEREKQAEIISEEVKTLLRNYLQNKKIKEKTFINEGEIAKAINKKEWMIATWMKFSGKNKDEKLGGIAVTLEELGEGTKEEEGSDESEVAPAASKQEEESSNEVAPAASKPMESVEKKKAGGRPKKEIDKEKLIRVYKETDSLNKTAQELGVDRKTVKRILDELGFL